MPLTHPKLLSSKRLFQFQVNRDLFPIFPVVILPKRRNIYICFVLCDTNDCFTLFNHAETSVGIKGFDLICKVLKKNCSAAKKIYQTRVKQSLHISCDRCRNRCLRVSSHASWRFSVTLHFGCDGGKITNFSWDFSGLVTLVNNDRKREGNYYDFDFFCRFYLRLISGLKLCKWRVSRSLSYFQKPEILSSYIYRLLCTYVVAVIFCSVWRATTEQHSVSNYSWPISAKNV